MLSLTKKSDAQPVTAPHWHANFRNFERLPDTKVVRTTFFINTAAVAVALGMLLWLVSRELTNRGIQEQIEDASRQVQDNSKQNAEALKLSKAFSDEQKKMMEAENFLKTPITMLELLQVLGDTLPREIVLDSAEARMADPRNANVQIRGRVAGSPDMASGLASSYVDMLKAHPRLGTVFDPITLNGINRDQEGAFLRFDISLRVKTGKK